MDRNTAIVKIILGSAETIRSMARDAIDKLDAGFQTEALHPDYEMSYNGVSQPLDPQFAKQFLDAIDATTTKVVGTEGLAAVTPTSTESETAEKKKRGRPRKADTAEAPKAKEVLESAPEMPQTDAEEEHEGDTLVAEGESFDDEPAPAQEPEATPAPEPAATSDDVTVEWVKENHAAAVEMAREFASKHMAAKGVDAARKHIKDTTGKVRASDCTPEDLVKYLNSRKGVAL
jgi:hypothetical protein